MTVRTQALKTSLPRVRDLCKERAILITRSYRETEGESVYLRRAKALKEVLEKMTIFITNDELLVGSLASKRGATPIFPEFSLFIMKDLDEIVKRPGYSLNSKDALELKDILEYWRGKTLEDLASALMGPETAQKWNKFVAAGVFAQERRGSGIGLVSPGYEKVLKAGFTEVINEAKEVLTKLRAQKEDPENLKKIDFLEAVIIACNAAVNFALRYASLARNLAQNELDARRKRELLKIASVCERIPSKPALTFYEALQSLLFCQFIVQIESNGRSVALGRFDQYMYPFYQKDLEEGRMTRDEAQELLECFYIKLSEADKLRPIAIAQATTGNMFQQLTIGGQTPDGEDASNDLSFLVLEAQDSIKMIQPNITMRCFEGMSGKLLLKGLDLLGKGNVMPNFMNDKKKVDYLARLGVDVKDARNYALAGCLVPMIPGKEDDLLVGGDLNNTQVFTFALNNGADPMTGVQLGPATGNPETFGSIEEVKGAYENQAKYFAKFLLDGFQITAKAHAELAPCPFLSALIDDCVKRGKSTRDGGALYSFAHHPHINGIGLMNVADSLAAIKKFVFEDKVISFRELVEALNHTFQGQEDLRQRLLRKAPKYGNDDDDVDVFAKEVVDMHIGCADPQVSPSLHNLNAIAVNVTRSKKVGATPDGRRAGEPVADGGVSPAQGRDFLGPTAIVRSAGKIAHHELQGALLNLKLHPAIMDTEENLKKLSALVKTYFFDLGGDMIQFNVVCEETLRAAQREPEKYSDLLIRVSGFCAYFTELPKDLQDDIMSRTTQETL